MRVSKRPIQVQHSKMKWQKNTSRNAFKMESKAKIKTPSTAKVTCIPPTMRRYGREDSEHNLCKQSTRRSKLSNITKMLVAQRQ